MAEAKEALIKLWKRREELKEAIRNIDITMTQLAITMEWSADVCNEILGVTYFTDPGEQTDD